MSDGTKKLLLGGLAIVLLGYVAYKVSGVIGEPEYVAKANSRTLMDIDTGKLYHFELTEDWGPYPHKNPDTGKDTLYPIEWCYNNECGKAGGTPVILNVWRGKPNEPTYCPKCGALVRFHNPRPSNAGGAEESQGH
ncbi:MAG TPA: hypothetical protein P5572_20175 [Phycisphaerae bacterium]|nr:hypothetical protein [Phycisphaerales bacterium]HRX87350.1 hypothetical protein [Phycisphaerae bacterium]